MSGRRRSFGANVLVSFGFTGLMTVLAFSNSVVIARLGGAEARGLYALGVAILGVSAPVLSLGLSTAATWAIGQGRNLAQIITLNHLWSGLLLLLSAAVLGGMAWWFEGVPTEGWGFVAFASIATVPSIVYLENARGAFLGLDQVVRYNAVHALTVTLNLLLNVALLRLGAWAVLVALGGSYWLISLIFLIGHARHVRSFSIPERPLVKESMGYGVKTSGSNLIEILIIRLDYLLVEPILGVVAVGLYSVGDQLTTVLAWGGMVAGRMMLAESARDSEGTKARRKLGLVVRTMFIVVGLLAVGAAATGYWIIPAIFGAEFKESYYAMLILLPAALLRGGSGLVGTYLMGRNVIRPVVVAGASGVALMAVFAPLAAWQVGWLGVAVVRVAAMFVQLALNASAYRIEVGEPIRWIFNGEDLEALQNWVRARLRKRREPSSSE